MKLPSRKSPWHQLALAAILVACGASVHAKGGHDPALPGELLLKLRTSTALAPLLAKYNLSETDRFGTRPIYRLKVLGTDKLNDLIKAMALEPDVLIVEPNNQNESPEARKNSPWAFGTEVEYVDQWAPAAIRLPEAHTLSTGAGTRVAVLDTGIDRSHPAFAGKLLPGFDFVDFDSDPSEGPSGRPGYGHGTHVAGLVALAAPSTMIMPVRVLDPDGVGNAWVLSEALLYAADPDGNPATDDGAHVVNMSLGSLSETRLFEAVSQLLTCNIPAKLKPGVDFTDPGYDGDKQRCAISRGAVMVVASGNNGSDRLREYPAAESAYGQLSIGASTAAHRRATFSNFGSWVDLAAPGEAITSTFAGGTYATWSGTSMAAPLASGTAALLRSRFPAMPTKDLARRIDRTTVNLCGGTDLRELDAMAALTNKPAKDRSCL